MNSSETLQNEQVSGDISDCRKINKLLNSSKTRFEGLQQLNSYLLQCPEEDFLQFCISWMQNCCKVEGLTSNHKDLTIQLLNDLFKISSNYQELKKSVSFFITTRYFDFFFKHFLSSQTGWSCTETCMSIYRGACGPFQESLEKHLKVEIEKNAKISSKIAYCYALLPSVGGGGNEGICYKKNWRTSFAKFLSIVHSLLNDLFADVEKFQEYETPEYTYNKHQEEISPAYLSVQIHNYCSVLSCMLLCEYPAPKSVPTDLIFQLLCRGLAVTPKTLSNQNITEILNIKKVLPEIHFSFLSLLKAVIVTCRNQLLPYSHLVCKLISQTLECTDLEFNNGNEMLGRLRTSTYEALCNWMVVTGNGSCVESISSLIISNAISDITSKKEVVVLKGAKHNQKKNRDQRSRRISATSVNAKLCHSALKALQFLLKFAGIFLKPEEHKFLQEFTVKSITQVQRSVGDKAVPFNVSSNRLELYALLVELTLHPCPKWPPPTHFALSLLKRGLSDDCPQICSLCSMASSMMSLIIHPQYNNGGFLPCEISETRSERQVQLQWEKMSEDENPENPCAVEDNVTDSSGPEICQARFESSDSFPMGETGPKERMSNLGDESGASSTGDSRTTVIFSKNASNESLNEIEETQQKCLPEKPSTEDESSSKLQENTENNAAEDQQSLEKSAEIHENKLREPEQLEPPSSVKSLSPGSASDESHAKKRYFLRSKTKGSSEEPEEVTKRAISVDSLKSTPAKNSPRPSLNVLSSAKRPRTRALSKIETNGDTEPSASKRTVDDDEDILATFDDSFVD